MFGSLGGFFNKSSAQVLDESSRSRKKRAHLVLWTVLLAVGLAWLLAFPHSALGCQRLAFFFVCLRLQKSPHLVVYYNWGPSVSGNRSTGWRRCWGSRRLHIQKL